MLNSISENSGGQLSNLLLSASNRKQLAGRAEVRAPLAHNDALNGGSATIAGFSGALVNPEIVLEIASPVDPIDACPISQYALL